MLIKFMAGVWNNLNLILIREKPLMQNLYHHDTKLFEVEQQLPITLKSSLLLQFVLCRKIPLLTFVSIIFLIFRMSRFPRTLILTGPFDSYTDCQV